MTESAIVSIVIWGAVCGGICLVAGVWGVFQDVERTSRDRRSRAERWTARVVFMVLALAGAGNLAVVAHVVGYFAGRS